MEQLEDLIDLVLREWPKDEPKYEESVPLMYLRLDVFRTMSEEINDDESLRVWVYFSYLYNLLRVDPFLFHPDITETIIDTLSDFSVRSLETIKNIMNRGLKQKLTSIKDSLEIDKKNNKVIRGEFEGSFDNLLELHLGQVIPDTLIESLVIQRQFVLEVIPLQIAYYQHLEQFYEVDMHLFASPFNHYYKRYGSHYNEDEVLGSGGDFFRDPYIISTILERGGSYEVNIRHLGIYYPLFFSVLEQKVLEESDEPLRFFIVYTRETNDLSHHESNFFEAERSLGMSQYFTIFSKDMEPLNDEEISDLLILLDVVPELENITPPIISPFEKAVLIGRRAEWLGKGDESTAKGISPNEDDVLNIAELEYKQKVLPSKLIRRMPNGHVEFYDPNTLVQS